MAAYPGETNLDEESDYNFLRITDLLKIKSLGELVQGCPEKFLELLRKSTPKMEFHLTTTFLDIKNEEYELSPEEKRIKLFERDEKDENKNEDEDEDMMY